MESVEASIDLVIPTRVADMKMVGPKWFVRFEGSWEFLSVGADKPSFNIGDSKEIVIRNPRTAFPL